MGVTKFYVDTQGNYLGGFSEGNLSIPDNAVEIESPPPHGWQKWDSQSGSWLPLTEEQKQIIGI